MNHAIRDMATRPLIALCATVSFIASVVEWAARRGAVVLVAWANPGCPPPPHCGPPLVWVWLDLMWSLLVAPIHTTAYDEDPPHGV